jgi:hypothetical protein
MRTKARLIMDVIEYLWDTTGGAPVAREVAEHLGGRFSVSQVSYYAAQLEQAGLLMPRRKYGRGYAPVDHCPTCGRKTA